MAQFLTSHFGVIIFIFCIALLLITWLGIWLTETSYPTHECRMCGKRFHGHRAADLADECEADHMHGGDKDNG